MYVYGELKKADLENLALDVSAGVIGRIYWNTATLKAMLDDGTNVRAFLRNDGYAVFGNNGSAASNIRFHRGAAAVLQFVTGADVTAEGTLSTALAQLSFKHEAYVTGSLPAAGNAGRIAWDTTTVTPKFDNGAAWIDLSPLTTKGDLYGFSTIPARLAVGTNGQYLAAASGQATGLQWTSLPLTTKGDLFVYDTTFQRLAVGTNGQYLAAASGQATGLQWTTFPVTTKGDLFIFSSTIDKLAVGTNSFALVADSAQTAGIKWALLVNANIDSAAAIAFTKLAATTVSRAIVSDSSGFLVPATTTAAEIGFVNGLTSSAQTQINTKLPITITTTGDILYSSSGTTAARLGIGSQNQILKVSGGIPAWATVPASGINYLSANPDAETDTSGWSTYADAAQNIPVDATGGSPSSTWTRTTSSPLRGSGSFLWTRTAANRQGEGVAYAFTIDSADQGRVLSITFDYKNASGTFFASDGITAPSNDGTTTQNAGNSDLEVFIYDVTNAVLIPVSPQVLPSISTTTASFKATFQTASNSTSYRLVIHTARSTAVAFTEQFDNFFVGPQAIVQGPPVTDMGAISWTPTGSWVANTTYTGKWARHGDQLLGEVHIALAGAPTSATLTVNLPSGFVIDTTKLSGSDQFATPLGQGSGSSAGGYNFQVIYNTTTSVVIEYQSAVTGAQSLVTQAAPVTWGNGNFLNLRFQVPIAGWSSTTQMSNDTDTRVVAAYTTGSTTSFTGATNLVPTTVTKDTHAGYSGAVYTVPVSGFYNIGGVIGVSASTTFLSLYYSKNGAAGIFLANINTTSANNVASGSATAYFSAGDTIAFQGAANTSVSTTLLCTTFIQRLSGPSAIAASESIGAIYTDSSGQSISNGAFNTLNYPTKENDSHSACSTSTWKFTAPSSGTFLISAAASFSGNATGERIMGIWVTGVQKTQTSTQPGSNNITIESTRAFKLLAGDYLEVKVYQSSGGALALANDAKQNFVSVQRLGN